jgi:hypothetical protein
MIQDNCTKKRIKPRLLRDVKTEALLVFARTALERFFERVDKNDWQPIVGTDDDTIYIYDTLRDLKNKLQECVVNVDYLINLVQSAKEYPELKSLANFEQPLITYYDVMARKVEYNIPSDKIWWIPELVVVCTLSHWIIEEEKSTILYPFLNDINYNKLIEKFEVYGKGLEGEKKNIILNMHQISTEVVEKLKNTKYKVNKSRVSKTRKKRK